MRRRFIQLLALLLLVLCSAVLIFWARSYWVTDHLAFGRPPAWVCRVWTSRGQLCVSQNSVAFMSGRSRPFRARYDSEALGADPEPPPPAETDTDWEKGRFRYRLIRSSLTRVQTVGAPCWFVCLALGAGPILAAARRVRRHRLSERRRARGLCARCAYDLRGIPAPARCPECGEEARA